MKNKKILKIATFIVCAVLIMISMSLSIFAEEADSVNDMNFILSGLVIFLIAVFMLSIIFLAVIAIKTGKKNK